MRENPGLLRAEPDMSIGYFFLLTYLVSVIEKVNLASQFVHLRLIAACEHSAYVTRGP